jgi:predicted AAA+ superfamily ATPase
MDLPDFLSRVATEEDWNAARGLLDETEEKHLRVALLYHAAAKAGFELNAASVARKLGDISDETVRNWINSLRKPSR